MNHLYYPIDKCYFCNRTLNDICCCNSKCESKYRYRVVNADNQSTFIWLVTNESVKAAIAFSIAGKRFMLAKFPDGAIKTAVADDWAPSTDEEHILDVLEKSCMIIPTQLIITEQNYQQQLEKISKLSLYS